MSKTAEEMTIAREFIKKTDLEKGSLWTETDDEIAEVLVDFHNQQSSSKDARIAHLELYEYTLSQARKHLQLKVGESIESKFDELEARLEMAEKTIKGIEATCSNEEPSHEIIWRIANEYITNKTD